MRPRNALWELPSQPRKTALIAILIYIHAFFTPTHSFMDSTAKRPATSSLSMTFHATEQWI